MSVAERDLSRLKRNPGTGSFEYAECLLHLGIANRHVGRLIEGESLLRRALATFERVGKEQAPGSAAVRDELGFLHLSLGELPRATFFFEGARTIKESTLGLQHARLAPTLDGLGLVLQTEGRYEDAEARHREALELRRLEGNDSESSQAISIYYLGLLHMATGDLGAAHRFLTEALQTLQKPEPALPESLASTLNSLAVLHLYLGQYDEAVPLLESAIALQEESLGRRSPPTFATMNNLVHAYFGAGDNGRGKRLYDEIEREFRDLTSDHVAWLFSGLGSLPVGWLGPR